MGSTGEGRTQLAGDEEEEGKITKVCNRFLEKRGKRGKGTIHVKGQDERRIIPPYRAIGGCGGTKNVDVKK